MPLLGSAALAMWWNMAAGMRAEFEDWHSHEHFPERLSVPGFRRASRYMEAAGGEGVFVLYELESFATLSSAAYVARLNAPTPWSTKLMPHHRHMVRSQCRVLASAGGGVARHAVTLRFDVAAGREDDVQACVADLAASIAPRAGLAGVHLLAHGAPDIPQTTEQRIRLAADGVAAWVLVACGYDLPALSAALEDLSTLERAGVSSAFTRGSYVLSHSATPRDVA